MKIEVWSDYVCPFCYIGKRKLEHALNNFEHKDQVEVVYRSFQLDPDAPKNASEDTVSALAKKYGMSYDQAVDMTNNVVAQAKEVGLDYDFSKMKRTNTQDAHRLTHFAAEHGKDGVLTEKLLSAYFLESKHIGDHDQLVAIAEEAGLNGEKAREVLESDQYAAEMNADIQKAAQIGVSGVPFFVLENKYAISGAQPDEVFTQALEKVWEETNQSPLVNVGGQGNACTDDSCDV
ncbi:DsbA family oxidoreductase [Jeotgalibacillus terrae]|uniref:DsbA family oxidoreductase n=1 Tax=Jeotgalibacillus terrae TaxID=587735 RepID=A0ABW5ZMP8_9BACL|nr:DsbA family oxidoreductase [Jeotgalibacillus terrae]MBM7580937.1 putative DsbA family dithiol-disulfide isomerase [Jeotgalibacillus terrae]